MLKPEDSGISRHSDEYSVTKPANSYWQRFMRAAFAGITAFAVMATSFVSPLSVTAASAASGDRTLYLYYTHTRETAKITFKRNGRYDKKGLTELNHFLRDWRRNEPTKMDPALFDLVWEVYQETGSNKPISIVSAYRAPATNDMLRSKSSGVAKNSRHTMGMAMDFYIPGVPISTLRAIAMKKQIGGVGYYPSSNSPFVHLDTGNVRAWPRMTRSQLAKIFPDGKTLHLPTDGVPLSNTGYQYAKAEWTKCHTVPCNGSRSSTRVASNNSDSGGSSGTLLGWLFGNEEDDSGEDVAAVTQVASAKAPSRPVAPSVPPTPHDRPVFAGMTVAQAPFPEARPRDLITTSAPQPALFNGDPGAIAVAAIEENTAPEPRTLMSKPGGDTSPLLTAYAPANAQIETDLTTASTSQQASTATSRNPAEAGAVFETAAINQQSGLDELGSLIESTWDAVETSQADFELRRGTFHAPDLDHVAEIFTDPQRMNSERYAVIFDRDQADLSPAAELGRLAGKPTLKSDPAWGLGTENFGPRPPLLVASR